MRKWERGTDPDFNFCPTLHNDCKSEMRRIEKKVVSRPITHAITVNEKGGGRRTEAKEKVRPSMSNARVEKCVSVCVIKREQETSWNKAKKRWKKWKATVTLRLLFAFWNDAKFKIKTKKSAFQKEAIPNRFLLGCDSTGGYLSWEINKKPVLETQCHKDWTKNFMVFIQEMKSE